MTGVNHIFGRLYLICSEHMLKKKCFVKAICFEVYQQGIYHPNTDEIFEYQQGIYHPNTDEIFKYQQGIYHPNTDTFVFEGGPLHCGTLA